MGDLFHNLLSILPWASLLAFAGVVIKIIPPMKKMSIDAGDKFRADLLKERADQEARHKSELAAHDARITRLEDKLEAQRLTYEAQLNFERASHAGEMSIIRHRMNNLDQCLTMLLELIETDPLKAQDSARRVRERREKQEAQETAEKAMIAAARIGAASPCTTPATTP